MLRFFRNFFASMSLERKCLLFFGSALLLLMFGAFWVLQVLASGLVIHQTRQMATEFGKNQLTIKHVRAEYRLQMGTEAAAKAEEVLDSLLLVLTNKTSTSTVLALEGEPGFENLPPDAIVSDPIERGILESLKQNFDRWLEGAIADKTLSQGSQLSEKDPSFVPGADTWQTIIHERWPVGDRYFLYKPIAFSESCMACHSVPGRPRVSFSEGTPVQIAQAYPYRVLKISMPYEQTYETNTQIRALLIAIAMMIIAVGLFVLHAIVRYLVLHPLYHLRDVSDAISHGDSHLRATIETEDEFRELADAFNRMLRHLTETQEQLREVNRELDQRVDQLAQLNLQLYEANRLKSDFLANMSHELRTPLNSIIGFSDVLQGIDSLGEKQKRYAANIQRSGRMLLEMINDILDLAKVEAGKMEVRRTTFNLVALVRNQVDMIRSLSDDKNLSVTIEAQEDLPLAEQDQGKIGQILTNLLSNAVKFTPEGGMITVSVGDSKEGQFEIAVADTGIGIAIEDQGVIFEKFRQSRAVTAGDGMTREFSGTGLGLSIVKELCKLLGGEIRFESQLGRGSTFYVQLPWRLGEGGEALAGLGGELRLNENRSLVAGET